MIQSKSATVLHINKISIFLISISLFFLWFTYKSIDNKQLNHHTGASLKDTHKSKYIKKSTINPFIRSQSEPTTQDIIPTITSLQAAVPVFSSLQLKLHGIVYQKNQNSYVMISSQGAIQEIYRLNDQIFEGLFITDISRKHIEVDYFGERHQLFIDNNRLLSRNDGHMNEITITQSIDEQLEFLEIDKKRNPIRLFMIRRPYAVYKSGEFQGYKIMPGSNEDQFKRLGFKSGDVITYLNGKQFTGPGMKEFVIQQLTHAMNIDLIVLRDGQELSISYGF